MCTFSYRKRLVKFKRQGPSCLTFISHRDMKNHRAEELLHWGHNTVIFGEGIVNVKYRIKVSLSCVCIESSAAAAASACREHPKQNASASKSNFAPSLHHKKILPTGRRPSIPRPHELQSEPGCYTPQRDEQREWRRYQHNCQLELWRAGHPLRDAGEHIVA